MCLVGTWNNQENIVINLELPDMHLSSPIPESLHYCESLQKLDLSSNQLSGNIPPQLCTWLLFFVSLDMLNNELNGKITLAECRYMNSLILSEKQLSGQILVQLSSLGRLVTFSVSKVAFHLSLSHLNTPLMISLRIKVSLVVLYFRAVELSKNSLVIISWRVWYCCMDVVSFWGLVVLPFEVH